MLLAAGVMALMTGWISPGQAFVEWGWRVPFLLSVVMILVGYYVRRAVDESPVFAEIAERHQQTRVPIVELFGRHRLLVFLAALVFAGNNAAGYMTTGGFITNYATNPTDDRPRRTPVLCRHRRRRRLWLVFTPFGGAVDRSAAVRRTRSPCLPDAMVLLLALVNTAGSRCCPGAGLHGGLLTAVRRRLVRGTVPGLHPLPASLSPTPGRDPGGAFSPMTPPRWSRPRAAPPRWASTC
jgi:MFS family permease